MRRFILTFGLMLALVGCGAVESVPVSSPMPLVLFVGNSLTAGVGASAPEMAYPAQTMRLLGAMTPWQNLGHPGESTPQMSAEASTLVDPQFDAALPPLVVMWEGTNDLFAGTSGPDAYQHIADYCAGRRAVGFRVMALTVLPMLNGTVADLSDRRNEANALLRANWTEFADAIVDVGADSALQDGADSTVFLEDQVHLTDTGYAVVATDVAHAIGALFGR
jgi:lysophospholipase L1-like esterase